MKTTFESYKKSLIDLGYLMPKSEEEAYTKNYGIRLDRLSNGASVISTHLKQDWFFNTEIEISSFVGAYFDPPKKSGLAHFYEHIMFANNNLHSLLDKHSINNNASTSSTTLKSYIRGIYNPEKSKYGMQSVYTKWLSNFLNPAQINSDKTINTERGVIETEIHNYYSDFANVIWDNVDKLIFHKSNYRTDKTLGTVESIKNIDAEDFVKFNSKYIVPQNFLVKIISSGSFEESKSLANKIYPIIDSLPNVGQPSNIDYIEASKVNDLEGKQLIKINTPMFKNTTAVGLMWYFNVKRYTVDDLAFDAFKTYFISLLRLKLREVANSYTFRHSTEKFYPDYINFNFHVVNDSKDIDKKLNQVRKATLLVLKEIKSDPTRLVNFLQLNSESLKAKVYNPPEIIDFSYDSYREFGLITNIDYIKKIHSEVTLENVMSYVDYMLKKDPVSFMIGDIK